MTPKKITEKYRVKIVEDGNLRQFLISSDFVKTALILLFVGSYSSNYITKKEPKSDDRLSKFDWHDLSPIEKLMLLHNLKVFKEPIKLFIDTIELIKF